MSAAELRKAAETLRERAEAATPGPWRVADHFGGDLDRAYVMPTDPDIHSYVSAGGSPGLDVDAKYIATMHPGVGLALAYWLDAEATYAIDCKTNPCDCPTKRALHVARLINGSAS